MAKYALVLAGGLVENIIEATPTFVSNADPAWLARYSAVVPATTNAEVGGTWTGVVFVRASPAPIVSVETFGGVSRAVADADDGKIVHCTAGTTVTITVPSGLTPGATVEYVQAGAGQVQIAAGPGTTLLFGSAFSPNSAEQGSSIVVTVLSATEAIVRGDLATA